MAASGLGFGQTAGHHSVAKFTHECNHHRLCVREFMELEFTLGNSRIWKTSNG